MEFLGAGCMLGAVSGMAAQRGYSRMTTVVYGSMLMGLGAALGALGFFLENGPSAPLTRRFEIYAGFGSYAGPILTLLFLACQRKRSARGPDEGGAANSFGPVRREDGERDLAEEYRRARDSIYGRKEK